MQRPVALSVLGCGTPQPAHSWGETIRMNSRVPMGKTERQCLIQTVVQQREVATQPALVSAIRAPGI